MQKIVDGVYIEMTAGEITEREEDVAQSTIRKKAKKDARTVIENNKKTGRAKLKDLGLTVDEISSLTTPDAIVSSE